jgi:DNA polymerase kappa
MAQYIALKLCPHLIIVPSRFDRYAEMSKKVLDVLRGYDPHMLAAGQDEAYLKCVRLKSFRKKQVCLSL